MVDGDEDAEYRRSVRLTRSPARHPSYDRLRRLRRRHVATQPTPLAVRPSVRPFVPFVFPLPG